MNRATETEQFLERVFASREELITPVDTILREWRQYRPQDFTPLHPSDRWHGYRFSFYDADPNAGIDLYQYCVKRKSSELSIVKDALTSLMRSLNIGYRIAWSPETRRYVARVDDFTGDIAYTAKSDEHEVETTALLDAWVNMLRNGGARS